MKISLRTMDLRLKRRVVGCGIQGNRCLALELSPGGGDKWSVKWSLAGELGDLAFAAKLSKLTGGRHFWVSPSEEGGLQVETARAIELPDERRIRKEDREAFFLTQIKSRFVDETVVYGGMSMKGEGVQDGVVAKAVHNVGGGAIRDNVIRDYRNWYGMMRIRRPHVASTALALANAYLALYPAEKRRAHPLRLIILKGNSVYRAILMDDWRYIDEILLPRMEGDDSSTEIIAGRIEGWMDYFRKQQPHLIGERTIEPLVIVVREEHVSDYEHWDLWGEYAMDRIDMTGSVAEPILLNRDIAPVAFGMALQGGC